MKTDICVLGGGIMGLAAAHNILEAGKSNVLILDRYGIGNDYCSSNDANRVFRYSYGNDELYTRIAVESRGLWRKLELDSDNELLIQTGLILLQGDDKNANSFNESSYRTLTRMGLGAERLGKEELKNRYPQFEAEEAFFDPHGGLLLASRALESLHALAAARGATFLQEKAREVVSGNPSYLRTDSREKIEFRKLIVTVGAWTNDLRADSAASIKSTRQQLIYFRPEKGIEQFSPDRCPVFFTDNHYGLPAGGVDAVKVSAKGLTEMVNPEDVKRTVDMEQVVACREACRRFVPGLADGKVVKTKVCLYDMTENSDFVIDKDSRNEDVVYGYGFSGHGFKFAPLIGKLLAQLALDRTPSIDLERFSANPRGRTPPSIGAHLGKGE